MTILELVDAVGGRQLKSAVGLVLVVGAIVAPVRTSDFLMHEGQAAAADYSKALLQIGEKSIHAARLHLGRTKQETTR